MPPALAYLVERVCGAEWTFVCRWGGVDVAEAGHSDVILTMIKFINPICRTQKMECIRQDHPA